jgi:hypothetical protein
LCFYRFYSFEHWTMDRVQKPNNHVQHTPSSESFQVYSVTCIGRHRHDKHVTTNNNPNMGRCVFSVVRAKGLS